RSEQLLVGERHLVLDLIEPRADGRELRVLLRELRLEALRRSSPAAVVLRRGQRRSLIMTVGACRSTRASDRFDPPFPSCLVRSAQGAAGSDAGGVHGVGRRTYFTSIPSSSIARVVASSSTRVAASGTFGMRKRPCESRL